jgi:hypothetical protein
MHLRLFLENAFIMCYSKLKSSLCQIQDVTNMKLPPLLPPQLPLAADLPIHPAKRRLQSPDEQNVVCFIISSIFCISRKINKSRVDINLSKNDKIIFYHN